MSTATGSSDHRQTAAALAARRTSTRAALQRIDDAVARLRREKTTVTIAAIARRAGVSRTFLYDNPQARAAVAGATAQYGTRRAPGPSHPGRRAGSVLAGTRPQRRRCPEGRPHRDHHPARQHRRSPGPGPGPGSRMDQGDHPAHHHREHHAQTASTATHHRQPDPGRTAESRPVEHAVPGPPPRRPRSPARRPIRRDLTRQCMTDGPGHHPVTGAIGSPSQPARPGSGDFTETSRSPSRTCKLRISAGQRPFETPCGR